MTDTSHATLADYLTPPLRRWPVVAVAVIVGALAGVAWAVGHPSEYVSVATVQLRPGQTMTALEPEAGRAPGLSIDTDAQLLLSDDVVSSVVAASGRDAHTVRESLTVQAPALSTTLRVGFRAPTADSAQAGAQAAGEALLSARAEVLGTVPESVSRGIRSELALRESSLNEGLLPQRVRSALIDDASQMSLVVDRLEAQAAIATSGMVVSEASVPARTNRVLMSPAIPTGLGAGLLIGVTATWWLDRRSRRERHTLVPDDCRQSLLVDALRHHRALLAAATLVGAGVGLFAGLSLQPSPTATTRLLVTPLPGNALSPEDQRRDLLQMQNEAQVVKSDPVLSDALRTMGRPVETGPLRRHVAVSAPAGATTLEVRVRDADPADAEEASMAVAESYLAYRAAVAADRRADVSAVLEKQIQDLDRQLQTYLVAGDERFNSRAQVTSVRLTEARGELDRLAATGPSGRVLSVRRSPLPGPWLPLVGTAAGLVLGVAVGAVAAVGRERAKDLVRHHDCVRRLGAEPLAPVTAAMLAASPGARRTDLQIFPVGEVSESTLGAVGLPVVHEVSASPGSTLLAIHLGHATHDQVAEAVTAVRRANRELVGAVVWPAEYQQADLPGLRHVEASPVPSQ